MTSSAVFFAVLLLTTGLCQARWAPAGQQLSAAGVQEDPDVAIESQPRTRYRLHTRGYLMPSSLDSDLSDLLEAVADHPAYFNGLKHRLM